MTVSTKVSKLSAKARTTKYLVRRGSGWRFQMRMPSDLKKYVHIEFFRWTIGPSSIREANRKALILAVAAESIVSKVREQAMQLEIGDESASHDDPFDLTTTTLAEWKGFTKGLIQSLDLSSSARPSPSPWLDGLKELILLDNEFKVGAPSSRYLIEYQDHLRQGAIERMRGAPMDSAIGEPGSAFSKDAAGDLVAAMERFTQVMGSQLQPGFAEPPQVDGPTTIPMFRAAADVYIETRVAANGGRENGDIHAIRSRAALFAEVIGDRPIGNYGPGDLQKFLLALQCWPPQRDSVRAFDRKTAKEILAMNANHEFGVLARNTVTGHYLADVKAIFSLAASHADISNPFAGAKLIFPKIFAAPKRRRAPSGEKIADAFRLGVATGELHKAMILPLGYFTGRRIGLLTRLEGPRISRIGDYVVARISQHHRDDDGALDVNGFKTDESLDGFILHEFFDRIGFVDWAMKQPGFIFDRMNRCADPEDAMQKAANRLLRDAGTGGSYHGFRGLCITAMRKAGVTEYSRRVQSGHAPIDEHEEYGDLVVDPADVPVLTTLPFPKDFDIGMFMDLDFDAMART